MSGPRTRFKRMVVGLPQSIADQGAVDAAADLAEFLHIELLATFVADSTLRALAEMPAVRELRTLEQGWQAIDVAQITRDIDRAAGVARRRFAESVKSRTIKTSFDVLAGAEAIASLIRADDIVAIIEPTHPGESITRQFTGLVDAALETAAAILVVPRQIVRTSGPIMALAANPDDPSIRVAVEIAAALQETLLVVTRPDESLPPDIQTYAQQLGVHVEPIVAGGLPADAWALAPSAGRSMERLRVVGRGHLPDDAPRLFSALRGVPVLVIGPGPTEILMEQEEPSD